MSLNIVSLESLVTTRWLTLWRLKYEHQSHSLVWLFASRQSDKDLLLVELTGKKLPDAVSIVPFVWDEDGKTYRLIVTREFRPTTGGYEYSFPAGLRNGDEAV